MNNEELNKFRETYHNNILERLYEKNDCIGSKDFDKIFHKTMEECPPNPSTTKHVMVYMGSYIFDGHHTYLTYNNDPRLTYKIYRDIETGYYKRVFKNDVEEYEKKNKIVFVSVRELKVEELDEEYKSLKNKYYRDLLCLDQETAYKKLKRLTPSK